MKTKNKKKTKVSKKDPTEAEFDVEQKLADTLCDQFLNSGDPDDIDEAFVMAFRALSHRMLNIFEKDFVFGNLVEISQIVDEENGEPHVCEECQAEEAASTEARNKMH